MPTARSYHPPFGVGYEGEDLDAFLAGLLASGVDVLVDVRLNPISRKRGFSKRALAEAVEARGLTYRHCAALGNPKANRPGFAGSDAELEQARATYADLISANPESQEALADLARIARNRRIAVLCFEADQQRCHRDIVLAELQRRLAATVSTS